MERTYISFNITNTLTILAMVALGYAVVVVATQAWKNWFGGGG